MTELHVSIPPVPPTPDTAASQAINSAKATIRAEISGLEGLEAAMGDNGRLGRAFAQAVTCIAECRGRVVVSGIGKSGHIGRKIQATLASTGTPAFFVHPAEAAHGDLGMIGGDDVILMISQSGESSELVALLEHAVRHALPVLGITAAADSTLARSSTITLCIPRAREACPMGLAPTTSTIMQLALGDALALALLERRGFTADDFGAFHPGGRLGALLRPVSRMMHRGDAMPLGTPDMPLAAVVMEMTKKAFGCIGITDPDGHLIGLISDGDLRPALTRDLNATHASDIMNNAPITTRPGTLAQEAMRIMNTRRKPITSLFVLDDAGKPLGIVHLHDLLRAGVS